MNRLGQGLISLLVVLVAFGVTGQYGLEAKGTIDVSLIAIWLFTWLGDKKTALGFAVFLGLMFDFISFTFFGFWLLIFVSLVLTIDWLKIKFLTVSSFIQAITVLALITVVTHLLSSLLLANFNYLEMLFSVLFNVIFGGILYYLLAIKLKMFHRWSGGRL